MNPTELQQDIADSRGDGKKIEDTYIWLGGRPVAMLRGALDSAWQRLPDTDPDCGRPGESVVGPCGLKYIFTDYSPKPVLALNGAGAVVGVGEYSPFGEMNTRPLRGESVHPYARPTAETTLASWSEPLMGLGTAWRLKFDSFDTEQYYDPVTVKNGAGTPLASWTGRLGRHASAWIPTTTSDMSVTFSADTVDCAPFPVGCSNPWWDYSGVAVRSAEYRRAAPGVANWFPPIRFPGQYRDEETGFHENWNRFYDASTFRYLSPEPVLDEPSWVVSEGKQGYSTPTYAYARNNPIGMADSNGLMAFAVPARTTMDSPTGLLVMAELGMLSLGAAGVGALAGAANSSTATCPSPTGNWTPPQVQWWPVFIAGAYVVGMAADQPGRAKAAKLAEAVRKACRQQGRSAEECCNERDITFCGDGVFTGMSYAWELCKEQLAYARKEGLLNEDDECVP